MPRIPSPELVDRALACLESVAEQSRAAPIARGPLLRFALAWLFSINPRAGRWPYDWFWRALAEPNELVRSQNVSASLNAIYRAAGRERT